MAKGTCQSKIGLDLLVQTLLGLLACYRIAITCFQFLLMLVKSIGLKIHVCIDDSLKARNLVN